MVKVLAPKLDSLRREIPMSRGGFLSPNVIPPPGPNPGVVNICGDDIECFKPLRWSIVENPGDATLSTAKACLFAAPVLRLSKLGFLLPFSAGGLMKDGDEGSDVSSASTLELRLRARLLGFLALRGDGDVMGRSSFSGNRMGLVSTIFKL
jgi:hypothetical protein